MQGSKLWIGTTEAATLLRQFGVRARVVDFVGVPRQKHVVYLVHITPCLRFSAVCECCTLDQKKLFVLIIVGVAAGRCDFELG